MLLLQHSTNNPGTILNNEKVQATDRTKIKTNAVRAVYDHGEILKIIDESFLCHLGFALNNQPYVIPVCYGRDEERIFFHGARGSRMFNVLRSGAEICAAISIVDGIVLARSAFNHTINYRSVVIFGIAQELMSFPEKENALKVITEHVVPGRWNDVRKPTEKELLATSLFSLSIKESSAKIRSGPPIDDDDDMHIGVWAGVLPLKIINQEPVPDLSRTSKMNAGDGIPYYIKNYRENFPSSEKGII